MALVLIADDSMFQRFFLRKIAASLGHEVLEAGDGRQLLATARDRRPDLILMDLNMPELPGVDVLEAIRDQGIDARTVVITADIQQTTRARCLELGAAQVFNKPVDEADVREAMNRLLGS